MTCATEIEQQLTAALDQAAKELNLIKYSLNLNLNAQRGDGFLGEFYKVSIIDKETNTKIDLALKKAPQDQAKRDESSIESVYKNEIRFYSKVYPALKNFERQHQVSKSFDAIPEYITSVAKIGEEIIVFKDITFKGFELREKQLLLDDEHARLIFETYGHFHAISFCLKEQKPEEFEELMAPFCDIFEEFENNNGFCSVMEKIVEKSFEALDPEADSAIREKFKKYVDKTMKIFMESVKYEGKFSGILHGDCWSNNMMFKYKNSKLEAINLLDFQLVRVGTPVYDLSYFFYTGGSKELFDKLEDYLDIYYASFSRWAKELGGDPEKLLPRKILTEEWKKYSKFGMLMAFLLCRIKLISKEDSIEMTERAYEENQMENENKFMNFGNTKNIFNKRVRDILIHMYEIDAL